MVHQHEPPPHPKGALAFMLIYLAFITLIWLNAYMRLWWKG